MGTVCVEIEMDTDTGKISVAECAPDQESGEDGAAAMQAKMGGAQPQDAAGMGEGAEPAGQEFSDIGDALKYAATLLLKGSEGATSAAFAEGGDEQVPQGQGGM